MLMCKKGCIYYGKGTDSCDFYLITGIRRGCDPNECTRYTKGEKKNTALQDFNLKRSQKWDVKFDIMKKLYLAGKYDKEIAEELKCAVNTVKLWRKRNGLVSQTDRQKKLEEERRNLESKT